METIPEQRIRRPTLLVVDDEQMVTQMLGMVFELCLEADIVSTNSAIEARDILEKKKISLLLTDYLMPEMNGVQLIRFLRDQGSTIPVIVLTGYCDEPELAAKAEVLGPFEVLVKPWSNEFLVERVKFWLEKLPAVEA